LEVVYQGRSTGAFTVPVVSAAPELFSADGSGTGSVAGINQDGTLVAQSAAQRGSVVSLFGTGLGMLRETLADGTVPGRAIPLRASVSVTIGSVPAVVQYAGTGGDTVAGVTQLNVVVPMTLAPGMYPVIASINGVSSQTALTLTIR
jgi:uncharacterized protein (TIGR03437 family)